MLLQAYVICPAFGCTLKLVIFGTSVDVKTLSGEPFH